MAWIGIPLYVMCLWLLSRFFSLSLVYKCLIMICLNFISSCLKFIQLFRSVGLCFSPNLGSFQPPLLQILSSSLSLLPLEFWLYGYIPHGTVPRIPESLFNFIQSIFYLLRLGKFGWPILKFMDFTHLLHTYCWDYEARFLK